MEISFCNTYKHCKYLFINPETGKAECLWFKKDLDDVKSCPRFLVRKIITNSFYGLGRSMEVIVDEDDGYPD